ncbi:MAG TPA: single-stranded DNA-binding protein [Propionibacteriaceae bacterium]|nr:single-stranded DNA-binding protein [Propionibacteriaceae bacterium]
MEAAVWITGNVGGDVEFRTFGDDVAYASLRVASTPRLRRGGEWVDGATTWLTVTCTRALAENVRSSVKKGDAVVVVGRLRTNRWEDTERGPQERLVLEAMSIGHDLSRGVSEFRRATRSPSEDTSGVGELIQAAEAQDDDQAKVA